MGDPLRSFSQWDVQIQKFEDDGVVEMRWFKNHKSFAFFSYFANWPWGEEGELASFTSRASLSKLLDHPEKWG